jgi:hypothetical protein
VSADTKLEVRILFSAIIWDLRGSWILYFAASHGEWKDIGCASVPLELQFRQWRCRQERIFHRGDAKIPHLCGEVFGAAAKPFRSTSLQLRVLLTQFAADKIEILCSFGFSEEPVLSGQAPKGTFCAVNFFRINKAV